MDDYKVDLPYVDTVFSWNSAKQNKPNKCRIRIYWITWEKAIIIATDITNIPGEKIFNVTEEIIFFCKITYNLVPNKTMLVEHYLVNDFSDKSIYLQVLILQNEVIRYEIKESKLIELIGSHI